MTKYAFISYVNEDEKDVLRICEILKQNEIDYWIDKEQLYPGDFWKTAIEKAIKNGGRFLAFFSTNSNNREKSYMREEVLVAIEMARQLPLNEKWIIPIKLSDCTIPDYPLGPGLSLSQVHYIETFNSFEDNVTKLLYSLGSERIYNPLVIDHKKEKLSAIRHELKNYSIAFGIYNEAALILIDTEPDKVKLMLTQQVELLNKFHEYINELFKI
jgi:hypothetical protein